MNPGRGASLEGPGGGLEILRPAAGQGADRGAADFGGNGRHRGKIIGGGYGETRLDDIDAHLFELASDLELLFLLHGGSRALLPVPEGRIEDADRFLVHRKRSCLSCRIPDRIRDSWEIPDA